jgi:NDP-sugar pyrophosphorylase family protein
MLLAAGEGQRLRPLTSRQPKPMLPLGGRPLLEHNVRLLAQYGIREIAINLHFHPEVVVDYFGDGSRFGVEIAYSHEPELLGTAGAVKKMASFFSEPFLVLYGDNFTDCRLDRLIQFHRQKGGLCTIAAFQRENVAASGIIGLDDTFHVTRFLEKPSPDQVFSNWVSAGLLVMEPAVLDFMPASGPSDFGRDVLPALLRSGHPIYGYPMTENLLWIDSLEDYQRSQELFLAGGIAGAGTPGKLP